MIGKSNLNPTELGEDRLARRSIAIDPGEIGVGIAVGSAVDDTLEVLRLLIDTSADGHDR